MAFRYDDSARRGRPHPSTLALARGLGWFSIALGLVEALAPRTVARTIGMPRRQRRLIQAYGVREIATGVAILASRDPTPWIWGRVAGDALDLATLAPTLHPDNPRQAGAMLATGAVVGVTALDAVCAQRLASEVQPARADQGPLRDYSRRRGFPRPPDAMRGAARDFEVPRDFRIPEPLRPWTDGRPPARALAAPAPAAAMR